MKWASIPICCFFGVLSVATVPHILAAQAATGQTAAIDWGILGQLVGHWIADSGGGKPGTTTRADETFTVELNGQIMVRHDHSEYAAQGGVIPPAHDGLLVIYPTSPHSFAAHSYDNEGHVIDYTVVTTDKAITFTSAVAPGIPRFRLTYTPGPTSAQVRFEIAPPNSPEVFQLYVTGTTHRGSF